MSGTDKVVKRKLMVLMLDEAEHVHHGWDYYSADVVLRQTDVPDTFKIIRNKVGPTGGLWRQVFEPETLEQE